MASILERIRGLDIGTRTKIVAASTIAFILIIFSVWIVTLPGRIRNASANADGRSAASPFSILQTLRGGGALIYQNITDAVESAKSKLAEPQSVTITPGDTNP